MKHFIYAIVFTAFLIGTSPTAYGQEKIELSSDPPPVAIRYTPVRKVNTATVGYNDKRDETRAISTSLQASGEPPLRLTITASYISKGTEVKKPDAITLTFGSTSKDRTYVDDRSIKIYLDGTEVFKEIATFDWGSDGGSEIYAVSKVTIPYNKFVEITKPGTLVIGIGPSGIRPSEQEVGYLRDLLKTIDVANGVGNGTGLVNGSESAPGLPPRGETSPMRILSKARANFTEEACEKNFSGTVVLRVIFLASGQIGSVEVAKAAPYGLTEQAIAAAKKIIFDPAKTNGVLTSVAKLVEYNFDKCSQ